MNKAYDAIIIGAGQAGPSLAGRLSEAGKTVALIERKLFGGTCVNTGCTPTKTMVASAYAAHLARRADDFGIRTGPVEVDMAAVKARKDAIVATLRDGGESWAKTLKGCTVYEGHARFISPHEVTVGEDVLTAGQIFINVGGRAHIPAMPGIERVKYLTNTSLLELETVPRHLVIIGGSYIGLEFAQMYRRFGAEVTVIEKGPRLTAREDEDISAAIKDILEGEGISVWLETECFSFNQRGDDVVVSVECSTGTPEFIGSHVLVAVGRRPNTDDLGLDKAGVALDDRGYIVVDDQLQTSVPGIWALGDCNGRGAFTHTTYNDFEIVAANLLDGGSRRVSDRIGAYGMFIDPPLGRAGMTEAEARKAGHKVKVATYPMTRVKRAIEKGDTRGFMKIVVDAETDAILGAAILGVGGDDAIHGILDTMIAKAPYTTLQHAMHIHPTVSELVPTMLGQLQP